MEHILDLKKEIDELSDDSLIKRFNQKPVNEGEFNYYPVFAKRIKKYKKLLFEELISERNVKIEFRTFKPSWYIAISILDYCEDEKIISEMIQHIKNHWDKDDYNDFAHYISKEERFKKYF
ncbi:hypothetical protein [Flavobacterium soli]|uniref:hypothetical protein n=1 Tax=Flavobacterium soli TaxID=344881 RepID=UPI0004243553|nr:hypothetical protein [Flavobacterium soli]